jgi:hypothetical protein
VAAKPFLPSRCANTHREIGPPNSYNAGLAYGVPRHLTLTPFSGPSL